MVSSATRPRRGGALLRGAIVIAVAFLGGCATPPTSPATPSDRWQAISYDGSKIGHSQQRRIATGNKVITESWMRLQLQQPGTGISSSQTHIRAEETSQGKALALFKTQTTDSANSAMSANVKGNTLVVRLDSASPGQAYPLPADFLLSEGQRLALLGQTGQHRKLVYSDWNFSEMAFERFKLVAEYIGSDQQQGPNADTAPVWRISRRRVQADAPTTTLMSDAQFFVIDEYSQSAGKTFAMEGCDQACAQAEFTPQTHVYRHLLRSPYRISDVALAGTIRYQLTGSANIDPPQTNEQSVTPQETGWQLEVCADCGAEPPPSAAALSEALQPNYWLTADDPDLQAIAAPYRNRPDLTPSAVMTRLSRKVTRHMSEIADYAGYATAAEGWANATGDCTEHALVLASLGRAAGIPTRIAMGLAYNNDRFLGRRFVFVPHMWVQAWTGQHWQSFDSALGDFNAGYITLALSQGDAAALIALNANLHQLTISSAVQVRGKENHY